MSLVSLDDGFYGGPKAKRAGEEAADLYVRGLAYCRRYNTAGDIPKAALDELSKRRKAPEWATHLVREVLWHDEGDHWRVHDYHDWYANDPAAKLSKQRKLAAARAKNYRDGHRDDPPPITPPITPASRDAGRDGNATVTSPSHDAPSRPCARVPNSDSDVNSDSDADPSSSPKPPATRATVRAESFALAVPIPAHDPYAVNGMDAFEQLRGASENAIRASGGIGQASKFGAHVTAMQRQLRRADLIAVLAAWAKAGGLKFLVTRTPTTEFLLENDGAQLTRSIEAAIEWDAAGRKPIARHAAKGEKVAPLPVAASFVDDGADPFATMVADREAQNQRDAEAVAAKRAAGGPR